MNSDIANTSFSAAGGKTLLVIRHAKSSWEIGTLSDFDRPLNERGKRDAPVMAARVKERNVLINAFVSSPAKRAKKTAELFAEALGYKKEDIILLTKLYHAGADIFYEVVEGLDDSFNTVAIFSHNPGITEFVNLLAENVQLDNMPTCGVFAINIHTDKWAQFRKAKKDFLFFDYPKLS